MAALACDPDVDQRITDNNVRHGMLDNVFDTVNDNDDFVGHINTELARLYGQGAVAAGR